MRKAVRSLSTRKIPIWSRLQGDGAPRPRSRLSLYLEAIWRFYSGPAQLWENEENAFALLSKVETGNGNIIGTCLSNKPAINFTIKLKIAGDITYDTVVSKEEFNNVIGDINTILASITGGIE